MTRFLLIRHATTYAVGKRLSGRMADVHLNEQGREQAQQLAQRLTHLPIDAIYSSPLERATETAEPLAQQLQLPVQINEDFLEINFGNWTNLTFEEVKQQRQFDHFNTFRSHTRIPGGETMLEAQTRMITGLQILTQRHSSETVAVVSHADLIKSAITYYAGIPLDLFQRIEISPASVSILELYEETLRILVVNDTGDIQF